MTANLAAFSLGTPERMLIELTVTEADLLSLEVGQAGLASFDAIEDVEYPVRIASISRVPNAAQGVVTYDVEARILIGAEIAEVASEIAALGGQAGGVAALLDAAGAAGGGAGAGGRGAGGGAGRGALAGLELPEGVTIQQVLQALANGEPLPEGVTLPEGFEIPPQLLQRLAAGALGQAAAQGAAGQAGAAARPLPAPGMSTSVTILTELREEAVLVPVSAVRQLDGAWFVTVPAADDGSGFTFERVTVEVGGSDGVNVEITSGLEAGAVLLIGADSAGVAFSATQQQQQQLPQPGGGFGGGFGGGGGGLGRRSPVIRLRDLTRVYATGGTEVHALAGVSLEIGRGEFVAIMGQSGSGKTTMMNIIGLLDRPSGGEYAFGGRDVSQLSEDARARLRGSAFGFVFQSYNLLPRMTALEQVELPLIYQGVRDRRRRAAEALVRVGLRDRITHQPTELSGGEQQRVAIARSLVVDPLVLLADEPTGALDTATGHELMTLLAELVDQQGLTVVLVTHEPEVAAYARRTVRMRDGRIIEDSGAAVRRPRAATRRGRPWRRRARAVSPLDAFRIALRAIFANRLRSALTSLGLIIGVSSVIVLIAVGQGTQKGVTDRIRGLGTDLIFVESSAAATTSQGGGLAGLAQSTLVQGDAVAIAAGAIPGVVAVTARVAVDAQAVAGANNVGASIVGTSSSYAEVRDLAIRSGSFITPLHDEDRSLVAVLGARVAETLYPGLDPVGQEVRLSFAGGRITFAFVVIGVLEEQGGASEANDQIFVPLSGVAGRLRFLFTPSGDLRVTQIDIQTATASTRSASRRRSASCCSSSTTRPSRTS